MSPFCDHVERPAREGNVARMESEVQNLLLILKDLFVFEIFIQKRLLNIYAIFDSIS